MTALERLYLNSTRDRVVRESDSEAAYLLVPVGGEVPKKYEALVEAMPKLAVNDPIEARQTRVPGKISKR